MHIRISLKNGVEYLFGTLESLIHQTYTKWTCSVVAEELEPATSVAMAFADPRISMNTLQDGHYDIELVAGQPLHPNFLAERKLRILTTVCNQPDYIRVQAKALKKWIGVDYEFIVFNDAKDWPDMTNFGDPTMRRQIEDVCKELGITCIPVQNSQHRYMTSASHRHCDTLQHVMKYVRSQGVGRYWMIDSDMWPIGPYSEELLNQRFQGKGTFVRQERQEIVYGWPNLWWLPVRLVEDLDGLSWNLAPACDTGGASAHWMSMNNVQWLSPHLGSCAWGPGSLQFNMLSVQKCLDADPRNVGNTYWSEIYDDRLFHIRAGSNWNGEGHSVHSTLAELVKLYFM